MYVNAEKRKGSLNTQKISTLINDIYATKEDELVCTQVHGLLPLYVEAEYEGGVLETAVTHDIETHLHHCPDCTELYQGMRFLVQQEADGELDLSDTPLPQPPVPQEAAVMTPMASSSD